MLGKFNVMFTQCFLENVDVFHVPGDGALRAVFGLLSGAEELFSILKCRDCLLQELYHFLLGVWLELVFFLLAMMCGIPPF